MDTPFSYIANLSVKWEKARAPRDPNAPTVISLFAGGGGSSLGYLMAGFRELLAVEYDNHAASTLRNNFPNLPIFSDDITKLTEADLFNLISLKPGELTVLDGSPPCQGFSTAGHRFVDDPRNFLFREYIRILELLKPKVFLMENVAGLAKGQMKSIYNEIIQELRRSGYRAKAVVYNALGFGVPQNRPRIIILGFRKDLNIFPSATTSKNFRLVLKRTLPSMLPDGPAPDDLWLVPELDERHRGLWAKTPIGKAGGQYLCERKGSGRDTMFKVDPHKPSRTISALNTGRGYATMVHPYHPRALSIDEAKLIMSFPLEFRLEGSYQDQWKRLGNAVPPLMAKALAEHVKYQLGYA